MLISFCSIGTRLGSLIGLLFQIANDDNLRALYDDEGTRTVTVEILTRTSAPATDAASDEHSSRFWLVPYFLNASAELASNILLHQKAPGLWEGIDSQSNNKCRGSGPSNLSSKFYAAIRCVRYLRTMELEVNQPTYQKSLLSSNIVHNMLYTCSTHQTTKV